MRILAAALTAIAIPLQGTNGFTHVKGTSLITFKKTSLYVSKTTMKAATDIIEINDEKGDALDKSSKVEAPMPDVSLSIGKPAEAVVSTSVPAKETKDMKQILLNDVDDTATKIENVRDSFGFRNDGKYWFMKTLMGIYKEGTEIVNGVPIQKTSAGVSEEEAAKRREKAAKELINIGDDEQQRRIDSGNLFLKVAAIYAAILILFVDQGDTFGHFVRFSVFPLYTTGYALRESGKAGL